MKKWPKQETVSQLIKYLSVLGNWVVKAGIILKLEILPILLNE